MKVLYLGRLMNLDVVNNVLTIAAKGSIVVTRTLINSIQEALNVEFTALQYHTTHDCMLVDFDIKEGLDLEDIEKTLMGCRLLDFEVKYTVQHNDVKVAHIFLDTEDSETVSYAREFFADQTVMDRKTDIMVVSSNGFTSITAVVD